MKDKIEEARGQFHEIKSALTSMAFAPPEMMDIHRSRILNSIRRGLKALDEIEKGIDDESPQAGA